MTMTKILKPFFIQVIMTNTTDEERNVSFTMTAVAAYYTGVSSDRVGHIQQNYKIEPKQGKT